MKKAYSNPELELLLRTVQDICTLSVGDPNHDADEGDGTDEF